MRSALTGSLSSMTLLAQLGARLVQQRHVIGAMHAVAQTAVFTGRVVLPQERAAFLGMAGITVFIDRALLQRRWSGGAVCIVAVAADHLVFANRMG